MSVNGVTSNQAVNAYSSYATENTKNKTTATDTAKAETTAKAADTGVVYEPSAKKATDSAKKTYTPETALIAT